MDSSHTPVYAAGFEVGSGISGTWNTEDAPAGSQFDIIYLDGGGAYYFETVIRSTLPDCHIVTVPNPQEANIRGDAELALSLDEVRWEDLLNA